MRLRPVSSNDIEQLREIATKPAALAAWRLRGRTPGEVEFANFLWSSAELNVVLEAVADGSIVGLLQLYDHCAWNGVGAISVLMRERHFRAGWPFEGLTMLLEHCFLVLRLRKIYFVVSSATAAELSRSLNRWTKLEGTLEGTQYFAGKYVDVEIRALTRSDWESAVAEFGTV